MCDVTKNGQPADMGCRVFANNYDKCKHKSTCLLYLLVVVMLLQFLSKLSEGYLILNVRMCEREVHRRWSAP